LGRLLIVANRLPVNVTKENNELKFNPSVGGLVTGLASYKGVTESHWVGWPGITTGKLSSNQKEEVERELKKNNRHPVFLSADEVDDYYYGFCNKTIWPLFHYFSLYTIYEEDLWERYVKVNQAFCRTVAEIAKPGDRIWVHDYHLMLLPGMLRAKLKNAEIGFFLHIPWPSFEIYRRLPWRMQILQGLLGSDLVGFHTYDDVRHFLSSVTRITGYDHRCGRITLDNRILKVDAFPMGIDYEKYSGAVDTPEVQEEIKKTRKDLGDVKIIASVDRLDYTKGIKQRLEAFDLFLSRNPEYKGKVTMVVVAVPSRTRVKNYMNLRKQLEQLIGRINGEHGFLGWVPINYLYRAVPFSRLIAIYHLADVALVTPRRDGMNLVSKEYIATKTNRKGVLILSEMAGAARELGEALIINPHNKEEIVVKIKEALEMPEEEQAERNSIMQRRLSRYTIGRWANDFLDTLDEIKEAQRGLSIHKLDAGVKKKIFSDYKKSKRRLLLLDYDGTLVSFADRPEKAAPDKTVKELLQQLADDSKNEVVVISGRDKETLGRWLGDLDISLVAEHGAWIKNNDKKWSVIEAFTDTWKSTLRPVMELYTDRTPGSAIEEKDYSLVWHFRRADPTLASVRTQELKETLANLAGNLDVGVYEGNKILEVKNIGVSKGRAAETWLTREKWDFIFAAGDDYTDESMFETMPNEAYTIRVGQSIGQARYNIENVGKLKALLKDFMRI